MSVICLSGMPEIEVTLRRSARARRVSLRVSALDGRVTLTAPPRVPERDIRAFAEEKRAWILKARDNAPAALNVSTAASLPVAGRQHAVHRRPVRSAFVEGNALILPERRPGASARAYFKLRARDDLSRAVDHYADSLDVRVSALTLRDTRSRWGSCTAGGRLMFSWRLAMAPEDVLDYVAAHEVAHRVHMDHSEAFWSVVGRLRPDWREARDWLRREGPALHAIRFED